MPQSVENQSLVSIIMPVRNMAKSIDRAITSILLQIYTHWELIIIDDGSSDNTDDVVRSFTDSRIRYISDGGYLGIAERLNQGIALSNGYFIARMDADDVAYPERIAKQVDYLLHNLSVDLLGTSFLFVNDEGEREIICPTKHEQICQNLYMSFPLLHPTWMARTTWFREWGYQKKLFKYGDEDTDLLFRSYQTSQFACLSDVLLAYHYSISLRKRSIAYINLVGILCRRQLWYEALLCTLIIPSKTLAVVVIHFFSPKLYTYIALNRKKTREITRKQWKQIQEMINTSLAEKAIQ